MVSVGIHDPKICEKAIRETRNHELAAIAAGETGTSAERLPHCECHYCKPKLWPADIEDQIDEYYEDHAGELMQ